MTTPRMHVLLDGAAIKTAEAELLQIAPDFNGQAPATPPGPGYAFRPITSAEFAAGDYRPQWMVKRLLVDNQPAVVGAPKKSMKTSIMVDLAISQATGTPFLGAFEVMRPRRVAIVSGESGEHTLQEIARRVCAPRGVDLADTNILWHFTLPQLATPGDVQALQRGLQDHGAEVLILDPLYLCLLAGIGAREIQASNMYQMGPLFLSVTRACLSVGCTPVLVHHTRMHLDRPGEPLELEDLAFAGVQEFARQWLLLSRRQAYEPGSGFHRLWLSAGGSIGHGGQWGLDIDEGTLGDDFSGRKWDVKVMKPDEARAAVAETMHDRQQEKKKAQDQADGTALLVALDKLDSDKDGAGYERVMAMAGLPKQRMLRAALQLVDEGVIEECTISADIGNGGKRPAKGLRRVVPGRQPHMPEPKPRKKRPRRKAT